MQWSPKLKRLICWCRSVEGPHQPSPLYISPPKPFSTGWHLPSPAPRCAISPSTADNLDYAFSPFAPRQPQEQSHRWHWGNTKVQRDGAAWVFVPGPAPETSHGFSSFAFFPFAHWENEGTNESQQVAYVHILTLRSNRPHQNGAIAIKCSPRSQRCTGGKF